MAATTNGQKTLWDIALEERKNILKNAESSDAANIATESHLLICGSKDSGKTSLIQRFLERDEAPKPTVGLEFSYGRKSKQNNMASLKDITQIWELGGGISMSSLMDVAITPSNIRTLSVVIVLDLSKPQELWDTQHLLLTQIKQRINNVISDVLKMDGSIEKYLKERAWERIDKNHKDKNLITPLLVPLVIIGSKFDVYQELSNEKKHMICKSIRFLSHLNGGMIQYFSTKAEGLSGRVKGVLNHLAFSTPLSKTTSFDHGKPLIIPFGSDSMEQIGAPPVSSELLMRARGGSPHDLWKDAFASVFPAEKEVKDEKKNPAVDKQFADSVIDTMRAQKDDELERYRKMSQIKAKEAQLNASVGKKRKPKR